tara:strand:- start:496 stop:1341 length:846 start_codon:yes stop_codon:yes gene_type:complete
MVKTRKHIKKYKYNKSKSRTFRQRPKRYIKKNVSKKRIRRNRKKLSKRFYGGSTPDAGDNDQGANYAGKQQKVQKSSFFYVPDCILTNGSRDSFTPKAGSACRHYMYTCGYLPTKSGQAKKLECPFHKQKNKCNAPEDNYRICNSKWSTSLEKKAIRVYSKFLEKFKDLEYTRDEMQEIRNRYKLFVKSSYSLFEQLKNDKISPDELVEKALKDINIIEAMDERAANILEAKAIKNKIAKDQISSVEYEKLLNLKLKLGKISSEEHEQLVKDRNRYDKYTS